VGEQTRMTRPSWLSRLVPSLLGLLLTAVVVTVAGRLTRDQVPGWQLALALVTVIVAALVHLHHAWHVMTARRPIAWPVTLALLAALTCLPLPWLALGWDCVPGLLVGSVLMLLPFPRSWCVVAVLLCAEFMTLHLSGVPRGPDLNGMVAAWVVGVLSCGLVRLGATADQPVATRVDLARAAVMRERVRFARDLHDLVGHQLSAIALRCEVALRLLDRDLERARAEMGTMLTLIRQAVADARATAHGYREMSVAAELASAQSILKAAGIDCRVDLDGAVPTGAAGQALAGVIRECVTNVLRHSRARRCRIEMARRDRWLRLAISNDGASGPLQPTGIGLDNIHHRITSVGGWSTVQQRPDGWFQVVAEIPVSQYSLADHDERSLGAMHSSLSEHD